MRDNLDKFASQLLINIEVPGPERFDCAGLSDPRVYMIGRGISQVYDAKFKLT